MSSGNRPEHRLECDRREFFDGIAGVWDRDHCPAADQLRLQEIIGSFPIQKGWRVLDAGCGTGRILPILRGRVGSDGAVVEIDYSRPMLATGRRKHRKTATGYIQADAVSLPFGSGTFDAAIAFALFPHIGEKEASMREFRRVLKPGGCYYILHLMGRERMNELHAGVAGVVRSDRIPPREQMDTWFAAGGFASWSIEDRPDLYLATSRT